MWLRLIWGNYDIMIEINLEDMTTLSQSSDIREHLAALEHVQWAKWTRYMLDNLTEDNLKRWRRQMVTPYDELSEKEKDSDREWADKVMVIYDRNKS